MQVLWLYVPLFIYVALGFLRTVDQYCEAKAVGNAWMTEYHAAGLRLGVWVLLCMSGIISVIAYVMRRELFDHLQFLYWL
ncbi:MAG: hypothetical protein Q7R85_03115 [bacterium]|nr:hypothetical protein [bacterium]